MTSYQVHNYHLAPCRGRIQNGKPLGMSRRVWYSGLGARTLLDPWLQEMPKNLGKIVASSSFTSVFCGRRQSRQNIFCAKWPMADMTGRSGRTGPSPVAINTALTQTLCLCTSILVHLPHPRQSLSSLQICLAELEEN